MREFGKELIVIDVELINLLQIRKSFSSSLERKRGGIGETYAGSYGTIICWVKEVDFSLAAVYLTSLSIFEKSIETRKNKKKVFVWYCCCSNECVFFFM